MSDVAKYSTRISYSSEDEGYIATVPELPGCSAFGETASEALTELTPAIEAWISAAQEAGNPVPAPAALDDDLPSGKFLVRVARTVHAQLSTSAQREGVSLNQYVSTLLATATLGDVYTQAQNQASRGYPAFYHHSLSGTVEHNPMGGVFIGDVHSGMAAGTGQVMQMIYPSGASPAVATRTTTGLHEHLDWAAGGVAVVGTGGSGATLHVGEVVIRRVRSRDRVRA